MSKKYPSIALPQDIAQARQQEQDAQAQIIMMRNNIAAEIYTGLAQEYVRNFTGGDIADQKAMAQFVQDPSGLGAAAAASLTAAMVFLEVAGIVRRIQDSEMPGAMRQQ
jgi:hypothetical protein